MQIKLIACNILCCFEMHPIWLWLVGGCQQTQGWISGGCDSGFTLSTSIQKKKICFCGCMTLVNLTPPSGVLWPTECHSHSVYGTPTKWLMRSNDELHSQFNPGAWGFRNRTYCRGYASPNPGHLWSSKSLFSSCLIIWTGQQSVRHVEEAWGQ